MEISVQQAMRGFTVHLAAKVLDPGITPVFYCTRWQQMQKTVSFYNLQSGVWSQL